MTFEEKQKIIFTYAYIQSAVAMIEGTLEPLKRQLSELDALITEKAAPTAVTVEAAKETMPTELSDNTENLSSFHVGQKVHTPDGDGEIINITYVVEEPFVVKLSDNKPFNLHCGCYKDTDLTPL